MTESQRQKVTISTECILERLHEAFCVSSDAQLARKLDKSPSAIAAWRARGTVPYESAAEIAENEGFSLDWLLLGREPKMAGGSLPENVIAAAQHFAIAANNMQYDPARFDLVAFRDIAVSAGGGAEVLDETPKEWRLYPRAYLSRRGLVANMLDVFSVRGDSMLPELGPGDSVLVDRRVNQIGPEDIYVVRVDTSLYIKYVRAEKDRWILRSLNSAYPEIEVRLSDYGPNDIVVIGRVVRISRDR